MRRKRCKTQVQGTSPMALLTKLLDVEESGLSRWPWTLEHAGSNPAIQTMYCEPEQRSRFLRGNRPP